jgi:signal transduction histidine kinase
MTRRRAALVETVFDVMAVGLAVVDANQRIVLTNRSFLESLGLPLDAFPPGTPVQEAVRASALRGVYGPGDPEEQVKAVMAADRGRAGRLRRRTFEGRSFDLYNTPLPDGGYVVSAVESTALITARADAEGALAQTASALTTLRIGLAVFDPQSRMLLANPRFAALLALPPDRLVQGFSFDAMLALMETREEFAGPDGMVLIASLREAEPGRPWNSRRQRADGRSIDIMMDPLADGGRTISVIDATQQARAEDEARRRARLLDLVLLNVPHGICVYGPDRRVAMFNDTYNKVMEGAPLSVGDTLEEVIRRRAEAGEYGEGDPRTVMATQMAFNIARPQMRRRVRPSGTAIDVRTAPLPDGGHISVVTDISALVQAEAELRRRAADMTTMLGNIRHGVMLWGPDSRLIASNPVATELLDLPADLLTPGRDEADVIGKLAELGHFGVDGGPANGGPADGAHWLLELDRSRPFARELTTVSGRVIDAQSNPTPGGGWISTFTDITRMRESETELRRAKDLAEAANLAKSRFLATMSHELRTPLNTIIGFSDALAREKGNVPEALVADYSGQINVAGKQLLSLINIILDVARIESGRLEPNGEIVDLDQAIRAAVRRTDSAARAGEVSLRVRIPDDLPKLLADEHRIAQALLQLLSNAVKFTEAGGWVEIEAGLTSEQDLFVSVADNGIGIPDADLERVFEPFTQVDGSHSRRFAGAGLGLFTARAIVSAHGGQLCLTSRPGVGTTARVVLPGSRIVRPEALSG